MVTIYDVEASELIESIAQELKKNEHIKAPAWAAFCKTGAHKERPPVKEDWWYVRSASVLRKIRLLGPIGVSKLRTKYGGKQRRGYKSKRFRKGSGNIIRKILQQLEKAGLAKQDSEGLHKGRVITPEGIKLIGKAANKIAGTRKVEEKQAKKPTEKKIEEMVEKTKKFAKKEIPSAEKLVEELKEKKEKEDKKASEKPKEKKEEPKQQEKPEEVKKEEKAIKGEDKKEAQEQVKEKKEEQKPKAPGKPKDEQKSQ